MDNKKAEFDELADDYGETSVKDLGKFGKYRDTAFIYKTQVLRSILKPSPKNILDFGCGIGSNVPYLHEYFKDAKLYGCDVSAKSIEIAKKNCPYCDFSVINGADDLKSYSNIDCIFISTVLHHIPQKEHEYWIGGLYNILSEDANGGGSIVIFEHNMTNPLTKSLVKKTKIDEDATMLHPKYCKRLMSNHFYKTKVTDKEIVLAVCRFFGTSNWPQSHPYIISPHMTEVISSFS
jgi:trans-aconitate methyltransferase